MKKIKIASKKPELMIYRNEFEIRKDGSAGQLSMSCEILWHDGKRRNADCMPPRNQFKLTSCWFDKGTGNAIKAFAKADKSNVRQMTVLNSIYESAFIQGKDGFFTASKSGVIMFTAMAPGALYTSYDKSYNSYNVYNTKAEALQLLLRAVGEHVPVGGISLVNLNLIPESVMLEIGFEKVQDLLGVGQDMWKGTSDSVIYAGGRGSSRAALSNCQAFLKIIKSGLESIA